MTITSTIPREISKEKQGATNSLGLQIHGIFIAVK